MTSEQPQDIQPTQADIDSLAVKLNAFAATLTPAERSAFGQLLERAVTPEDDTQGHLFGTLVVNPLEIQRSIDRALGVPTRR